MDNLETTRRLRIEALVSWVMDENIAPSSIGLYDKLFHEARRRYPTLTRKTLESYAHSSLYIIKEK